MLFSIEFYKLYSVLITNYEKEHCQLSRLLFGFQGNVNTRSFNMIDIEYQVNDTINRLITFFGQFIF